MTQRLRIFPDQSEVHEEPDPNRQWNNSKCRRSPRIRLRPSHQSAANNESQRSRRQQNSPPARPSCLIQIRLHRNVRPARQRRQSLFRLQLSHPKKGIHRRQRNPKKKNHRRQSNNISVHISLLEAPPRQSIHQKVRNPYPRSSRRNVHDCQPPGRHRRQTRPGREKLRSRCNEM